MCKSNSTALAHMGILRLLAETSRYGVDLVHDKKSDRWQWTVRDLDGGGWGFASEATMAGAVSAIRGRIHEMERGRTWRGEMEREERIASDRTRDRLSKKITKKLGYNKFGDRTKKGER